MLVSQATYAYATPDGILRHILAEELTDRGAWSGLSSYLTNDSVSFSGGQYVGIAPSSNQQPQGLLDDYWSPLVQVTGAPPESAAEEVQDNVAAAAQFTANSAKSGANSAYTIATAGTNLAYTALVTAWAGTGVQLYIDRAPAAPDNPALAALSYPAGGGSLQQWDVGSVTWV